MLGTSGGRDGWAAKEQKSARLTTAEDMDRSQPLCFAFIDPMPRDRGDIAEWYRTQVTMLDGGNKAANKPGNLAKNIMREFGIDKPSDNIGEVPASPDR